MIYTIYMIFTKYKIYMVYIYIYHLFFLIYIPGNRCCHYFITLQCWLQGATEPMIAYNAYIHETYPKKVIYELLYIYIFI